MKGYRSKTLKRTVAAGMVLVFMNFTAVTAGYCQVPLGDNNAGGDSVRQALPETGNVTVNFKDVDIKTVLHYLSEVSGVDIVPSPGVDANITMRLRDKPWEVALDIVTRNYGYVYSRDNERGIIRVMPKSQLRDEEPITEVIPLNHLIREIALTKKEEGEDIVAEATQESILQLMSAINSILNTQKGERATYISSANAIVVTAIPARITEIKNMVAKIDRKTPQVILDAKVVEVTLGKDDRFGVDWNAVISAAGARRPLTFPFTNQGLIPFLPGTQTKYYPTTDYSQTGASNFPVAYDGANGIDTTAAPVASSIFSFGTLDFSTFTATLRLIENRDDTEILSAPRVTTLNNQKATIKVVEKIMLQKTQETTQTAGIVTVEFEKESEAREVGVKLTVIPHINEDGDISVNLLPEVSNRVGATGFDVISVGNNQNAIALTFNSREANTIVRVRDGETIFIGGLIRENVTQTVHKLPILGDLFGSVPLIGSAFKYDSEDVDKTEIAFFITVHIVKDGMSTIKYSGTEKQYEKYYEKDKSDEEKDGKKKSEGDTPALQTGKVITRKSREVLDVFTEPVDDKREYKPFLDFRKKSND
ncbi:MAG: hypothetical protein ABH883_02065 [Candidatus Omnitrophota bacterium]